MDFDHGVSRVRRNVFGGSLGGPRIPQRTNFRCSHTTKAPAELGVSDLSLVPGRFREPRPSASIQDRYRVVAGLPTEREIPKLWGGTPRSELPEAFSNPNQRIAE